MSVDYKKDVLAKIPILGPCVNWLSSNNADYGGILFVICLGILVFGLGFTDISRTQIFAITIALAPIWVTYFLFHLFFGKWMDYVGLSFALFRGRTTMRIKLPPEVTKSPEAMEFVISQIHNTASPDNLMQTYLQGKRPLPFSFEIVSIGGEVRFYVSVPTGQTKPAFEANLYAQYPGVEIVEEPVDYTAEIPTGGGDEWEIMSFHMRKKKPAHFPIKTYIDYGLDNMPKEEEKLDPITPMLEVLSSIGPDERVYVQFIAKSFRKPSFKGGEQLTPGEGPDWTVYAEEEINKMMNRDPDKKASDGDAREEIARLTPGERDTITAIERNMDKYVYKTGIRWMYIVKKGKFNGNIINPLIRMFSQFEMIKRNGIGVGWRTDTHYKDFVPGDKAKIAGWKVAEHKEYKKRVFYEKDAAAAPTYFTSEELATMWHLPGGVAITPTLDRVGSTRSEAPTNLPVGNLPT